MQNLSEIDWQAEEEHNPGHVFPSWILSAGISAYRQQHGGACTATDMGLSQVSRVKMFVGEEASDQNVVSVLVWEFPNRVVTSSYEIIIKFVSSVGWKLSMQYFRLNIIPIPFIKHIM